MAIEEAPYKVLKSSDKFELREYAPHILAETIVDGDQEGAGNKAFRRLFRYISGDNRSQARVAMTAPVSQEKAGEKISMTAPVGQQRDGDKWAVSFTMPSAYTLETLPTPDDPLITLRQVPARRMAAVRYSGFWSEEQLPGQPEGAPGMGSFTRVDHLGRPGLGALRSALDPLVPAAQRDPDPGCVGSK